MNHISQSHKMFDNAFTYPAICFVFLVMSLIKRGAERTSFEAFAKRNLIKLAAR